MFFGTHERFGVECSIYARTGSGTVLATMCLWAGGHRLGDHEQGMVLYTASSFFDRFLTMSTPRQLPGQDTKSDARLLKETHSVLGGDGPLTLDEYIAPTPEYDVCVVCPGGGSTFDGELAVLLEYEQQARFVWREYPTRIIRHVALERGECQAVLQEFVTWAQGAFTIEKAGL